MSYTMNIIIFVIIMVSLSNVVEGQTDDRPDIQPAADLADCICRKVDPICRCTFNIEHRLSMVLHEERLLVVPYNGYLMTSGKNSRYLTEDESRKVITTDGQGSRLVIAINGKYPGPRVDVYENQEIEITVINNFHTDSVTVHFHGLHQRGTPWMDGVATVTQCPILPGHTFVYRFKAYPPGTSWYHAHIGDQRSMGLYGPFIVRKRDTEPVSEIIVSIQDFNHLMDAETAYLRMITEQYNVQTGEKIPTTHSVDGAQFSRFEFQSGLINGKGRYWITGDSNNGAPLERFKVEPGKLYRFRAIGAMTLYPMRIYIEGQTLSLRTSDCYNLKNRAVESIIIHPGERYDFHVQFQKSSTGQTEYLLVAETIEAPGSYTGYHAAEAVINVDNVGGTPSLNPPNNKIEYCFRQARCAVFNCPYGNAGNEIRNCSNYNDIENTDPYRDPSAILGNVVDKEYFFNFAFPGFPGNTPGSVNGRTFVYTPSPLLTQSDNLRTACNDAECREKGICSCTYIVEIPYNKRIQMVFTNIGNGSGWSHPIHLHGTSFFVIKIGLGTYDSNSGRLLNETTDIICLDKFGFCTEATWRNKSWRMGNLEGLNQIPPLKDTIVVPTGGYVVVRFISDNPGMWFLHCHIDLHNTNGMAMVLNVAPGNHPRAPVGFPHCGDFRYNDNDEANRGDLTCAGTSLKDLLPIYLIAGFWLVIYI